MSNFETIPAVTGSLTKKWDQVILTGEIFRAKVHPKQLKELDKAYDVSLKLSPETFKMLKTLRLDKVDAKGNVLEAACLPLTGLKKVELKKRDEEGELILDEMDDPIMEFSHYQITVRQNKVITTKGETKSVYIPVNMVEDGEKVTNFLNEGSKVSVLVSAYETIFRDKPAAGLNLKEVKVHEAVVYEGGSGGSAQDDPWTALGMSRSEVPSFDEPAKQEAPVTQESENPAPQAQAPSGFDDFDDDIPF